MITDIIEGINKNKLNVSKPDKKLSTIQVTFVDNNQVFVKSFIDKLVETVNDYYIQTKTQKSLQEINILQREADSVKYQLNRALNGVASANDAAPSANPLLSSLRVPGQRKQVDIQANTAIYSEVVKNLEISKIALRQETPLVHYIDRPVLPLKSNKVKPLKGMLSGFFLGMFAVGFYLVSITIINKLLTTSRQAD